MKKAIKASSGKATKAAKKGKGKGKFNIYVTGERIFTNAKAAFDLYSQSRYGESLKGKVYYSFAEAFSLFEKGKINVYLDRKKLNHNSFMKEAIIREPNFWTRYTVYNDLRSRGYIVKTALKFGADFRVYEKGVKPGEDHAKWIVYPVYEASNMTWHEFAAKNRVAHSTKKNLLIAIVDDEGDVTYYEVKWLRP
jgi:tRNA-intron endonuclease